MSVECVVTSCLFPDIWNLLPFFFSPRSLYPRFINVIDYISYFKKYLCVSLCHVKNYLYSIVASKYCTLLGKLFQNSWNIKAHSPNWNAWITLFIKSTKHTEKQGVKIGPCYQNPMLVHYVCMSSLFATLAFPAGDADLKTTVEVWARRSWVSDTY